MMMLINYDNDSDGLDDDDDDSDKDGNREITPDILFCSHAIFSQMVDLFIFSFPLKPFYVKLF